VFEQLFAPAEIARFTPDQVRNGLEQGLDFQIIAALTGLSMKAIEKIAQDIHEDEP
jgi:hypothetical protein